MCSGQEPDELTAKRNGDEAELKLRYCGFAPLNIRGPFTGELYRFSRQQPEQRVDGRDAVSILRTRLFRKVP
jgi:hypothetical protein